MFRRRIGPADIPAHIGLRPTRDTAATDATDTPTDDHRRHRPMRPLDPRLLRHASAARRFIVAAAAVAVATAGLVMVQAQLLAGVLSDAFLGGAGLGTSPRRCSASLPSSPRARV